MRRFESWGDELRYRVERIGVDGQGEDEKYAGGVYDMALDMVEHIEGYNLTDDELVDYIYSAIKYGNY